MSFWDHGDGYHGSLRTTHSHGCCHRHNQIRTPFLHTVPMPRVACCVQVLKAVCKVVYKCTDIVPWLSWLNHLFTKVSKSASASTFSRRVGAAEQMTVTHNRGYSQGSGSKGRTPGVGFIKLSLIKVYHGTPHTTPGRVPWILPNEWGRLQDKIWHSTAWAISRGGTTKLLKSGITHQQHWVVPNQDSESKQIIPLASHRGENKGMN